MMSIVRRLAPFTLLGALTCAEAGWRLDAPDTSPELRSVSLAIAGDDAPGVAWGTDGVFYAHWNGTEWIEEWFSPCAVWLASDACDLDSTGPQAPGSQGGDSSSPTSNGAASPSPSQRP